MRSIQDIHNRLTKTLTEHIDATINKDDFQSLKNMFELTPKNNKDANNMSELLAILEKKDIIAPGRYDKLKEALLEINVKIIREVIEPIEEEIKGLEPNMFTSPGQAEIDSYSSNETESGYRLEAPGVDYELKLVLLKIAQKLTYKNIEEMKFLLYGEVNDSVLKAITTPLDLFNLLINDGKLSFDNILYLQVMLHQIKRGDLFKELMEYGKKNRDTLHFYEPHGNPANGYKDAKFHVACKENLARTDLEWLRTTVAKLMGVDNRFVSIRGCEVTNSFLITLMVPELCLEFLCNLDYTEQQSFLSFGIDFFMVDDDTFLVKEDLIEKEEVAPDNTIVLELKRYMQQTGSLQKKLEKYQMKEMTKPVPHCCAYSSISWTITATMFYLLLQDQRKGPLESDSKSSASNFFTLMEQVKLLSYDMELIESLLEARSLVERKLNSETHRLLIIQQTTHMQMLEHMLERAKFKENKLKFLLHRGLNDPILSEKDEHIFHLQQLHPFLTENIQIEVGMGQSIDRELIEPIFTKMSAELQEKDIQKLRKTFQVNPDEEILLMNQKHCFIEVLAIIETKRTGIVVIDKFSEKIISAVDRKDFEEKWKNSIKRIVEDQKQKGANPEQIKASEMVHQLVTMNKRMANVENLIKKPKLIFRMDDDDEDGIEGLLNNLTRRHIVQNSI